MSKASIYTSGVFFGIDNKGKPLSYGTVSFTDHNTGEVIYTYQNAERTEVNDNPVTLTASGKANIFLEDGDYDIILRDQYGTIIESLINFSPSGGGGSSGGAYQGEYTPVIGAEYPEDNPKEYGIWWTLAVPWTFQTGDLAGEVGTMNDGVMWSVNGWTLLELNLDLTAFLKRDGTNEMIGNLDAGLNKVINMLDGEDQRDAVAFGQLQSAMADIWTQSEFIDKSEGIPSADLPVKTNAQGMVDASFLEIDLFKFIGEHDPRDNEYPDETGLNAGDFYTIDLPTDTTYEFTTGNLIGRVVKEGDAMLYISPDKWGLITVSIEATDYVKIDGSHAMIGNLSLGNNKIINLSPAELGNEAVTLDQMEENSQIPPGMIVMWWGQIVDIPSGWLLCNGENGTPNMTDRFPFGTNQQSEIGDIGGDNNATMPAHTHSISNTSHTHSTPNHTHSATSNTTGEHSHTSGYTVQDALLLNCGSTCYAFKTGATGSAGSHSHTITVNSGGASTTGASNGASGATESSGGTGDNRPSFVKLVFIMKV